jgi:hypothetical protein
MAVHAQQTAPARRILSGRSRLICRFNKRRNCNWSSNIKTAKALGLTIPPTFIHPRRPHRDSSVTRIGRPRVLGQEP